jgi:hypothetical protein
MESGRRPFICLGRSFWRNWNFGSFPQGFNRKELPRFWGTVPAFSVSMVQISCGIKRLHVTMSMVEARVNVQSLVSDGPSKIIPRIAVLPIK